MNSQDTIAAIATAAGRAGIGIVRVSGTGLDRLARALTGRSLAARRATVATFRGADGEAIDEGLALYFPAPTSYTGQDVLELHGHGGPVVLRSLLQRCVELGARLAAPGEFTQRAFLNGKLDLVQAEGVIDLIDATTARAARSAMHSLRGDFSSAVQRLSGEIVDLRAFVEATLDFPEEELDLDETRAGERLGRVRRALDAVLDAAHRGSLLREGMHVVLAGQPNVGKSSLLNRLARDEVAIVTDVPGTTRDAIRQVIDIEGVPAHVVDTAGLRDSADPVERIGVERAWGAIAQADVVLHLVDARVGVLAPDQQIVERLPAGVPRITVFNKIDLAGQQPRIKRGEVDGPAVWLSAKTGGGMELLRELLLKQVGWQGDTEGVFLARERHLRALSAAKAHLDSAARHSAELLAEELRLAHEALSSMTGEFTPDDLLGEIFQRFCIGK